MATRAEIIEAIEAAQQRLERLTPQIEARPDLPLLSGSWTVRDAVCHMAADGNAVPRFLERVARTDRGEPGRAPGFDIDAYNEANIAQRRGRALADVLAEVHAGFRADTAGVQGLDEAFLAREAANARGVVSPVSDQVRFTTAGHPNLHLDDIESALGA